MPVPLRAGLAPWSIPARQWLVLALLLAGLLAALVWGPISRPGYIDFADTRSLLGVPHFYDVVSNLGFLLVGLYGLWILARPRREAFVDALEITIYRWLFAGVVLTALGSAYFHWAPSAARLFWDRLPITIVLMSLLCATFAERISIAFARRCLVPLLIFGPLAALHWRWSVEAGSEDLRLYGLVQYLGLLIVAVLHAFPSPYRAAPWIPAGIVLYALAKLVEMFDKPVFAMTGGLLSGHTGKHLVAACALGCIVIFLARRKTGASLR